MPTIYLEGVNEFNAKLRRLKRSMDADEIEPVFLEYAELVKTAVKDNTPVWTGYLPESRKEERGALKRSIVAKLMQRRGTRAAPALIASDYRVSRVGHLVENGVPARHIPPNPFFRRGWAEKFGEVRQGVLDELKTKMEVSWE